MENAIQVRNLCKNYSLIKAIDDISFTVRKGSCFGLLGPNGAGKSTIMKMITGIIRYDGGTVSIFDLTSRNSKELIKKKVGYVPQEITLYEKLSAYNNLIFFGELYGLKGTLLKSRIKTVLEEVGLADHANQMIRTYSGGMKRRINIAAALLHEPELLILDEPTVGIDPQSRNHIFNMIKELRAKGVTIVYSTHYMEEVEALCDDIAIIDRGKIIAQGALDELLDKYAENVIYIESEHIQTKPDYAFSKKTTAKDKGWIIVSDNILGTIQDITQKGLKDKLHIKELEIVRPTLETVFLKLTGTSLRE